MTYLHSTRYCRLQLVTLAASLLLPVSLKEAILEKMLKGQDTRLDILLDILLDIP